MITLLSIIPGAVALPSATYGRGSGPTFLDNVACSGEELRLLDCGNNGIAYENCDHDQDAGVKCPGLNCCNIHNHKVIITSE